MEKSKQESLNQASETKKLTEQELKGAFDNLVRPDKYQGTSNIKYMNCFVVPEDSPINGHIPLIYITYYELFPFK